VAEQVNAALAGNATVIADAFATFFPNGIGQPLRTTATGAGAARPGRYFLPVPAGVPGFVRCHPPDLEQLTLATFVRARRPGERITGQNVTPATTLFSAHIARLPEDLPTTKANYLEDITGLRVGVTQVNGNITGFDMVEPENVGNVPVGWVAYAATALYTALYKQGINADYLAALRRLVIQTTVDPAALAEDPGVSPAQAEEVAEVVNDSILGTAEDIGADPEVVVSIARLKVRVQARRGDEKLPGATVDFLDTGGTIECGNCPAVTDADGEVTLTLVGVSGEQPVSVRLQASLEGFTDRTVTQDILAVAQVTVHIRLSPQDDVDDAATAKAATFGTTP
jgi:hypothetical protein